MIDDAGAKKRDGEPLAGNGGEHVAAQPGEGAEHEARRERRLRLGAFIRLHRQQLAPEQIGLASTPRKRTPGLRREDLAALCRVSSTWITWLEQGRDVAASGSVLARLADALRLRPAERGYLFELAGRRDPAEHPQAHAAPAQDVLRSVQAMNCPAYVLDRRWDVVACNAPAAALFLDWRLGGEGGSRDARPATRQAAATSGLREASARRSGAAGKAMAENADGHVPNLLRFLFLAPAARGLIHDWPGRAMRLVAEFRADCGRLADVPPLRELVQELSHASSEFATYWQSQQVMEREGGARRFQHPGQGALVYEQLTLRPALRPDLKLVMLLPPEDSPAPPSTPARRKKPSA